MRKSCTKSIFVLLIALLVQANLCQDTKNYKLKGSYIKYPQYLYVYGTVDDLNNNHVNMGYWRGFSRIQSGHIKLFFGYALTNSDNTRFLTMYAVVYLGEDIFKASIINKKYQRIGYAVV